MFEGLKKELIQLGNDKPNVKPEADQLANDVSAREKCGSNCSPDEVNKWIDDLKKLEQKGGSDPASAKLIEALLRSH